MSKRGNVIFTDTVSSINDTGRVVKPEEKEAFLFDYKDFCRNVMGISKRKADAFLLAPLKMYHETKDFQNEEVLVNLEKWMDNFSEKKEDFYYVWLYLAYDQGYNNYISWNEEADIKKVILPNAVANAKTYVNDVSKLENSKYIKDLCDKRDNAETWILNAYEITLKKIYSVANMALLIKKIIDYLNGCRLKIPIPSFAETEKNERPIFQTASNLMLLVTRLHLGANKEKALAWYRNGNVAYFHYGDYMLMEYMRLIDQFFYQSYERLIKMQELAEKNKNKYAAKEVGDIYRLGAELQDYHGNKIYICPDQEKACEYYRISMDSEYIPAYISAVKTDALINEDQKNVHLEKAKVTENSEAMIYYIEQCINEADRTVEAEYRTSLKWFKSAIESIIVLEEEFVEKQVLKNRILLTKTFAAYKKGKGTGEDDISKAMHELYEKDVLNMDEEELLLEQEKLYHLAGTKGYFEAEYQLGLLFQNKDDEKSKNYFEQGKKKGCKWCMLEYAKMQKEKEPEEWCRTMMDLGRKVNNEDKLYDVLVEEWGNSKDVLNQLINKDINLEKNELAELYSQIFNFRKGIYKKNSDDTDMDKNIDLLSALSKHKKELEKFIFGDI